MAMSVDIFMSVLGSDTVQKGSKGPPIKCLHFLLFILINKKLNTLFKYRKKK